MSPLRSGFLGLGGSDPPAVAPSALVESFEKHGCTVDISYQWSVSREEDGMHVESGNACTYDEMIEELEHCEKLVEVMGSECVPITLFF